MSKPNQPLFKAWRLDDNGNLDDLFAENVNVSIERMDNDLVHLSVSRGKQREDFTFYAAKRGQLDWKADAE